MLKNLFCLFFVFVLIGTDSQTAKAETIVTGNSCTQVGTSVMATDQKSIVTCLKNDSGVLVWKSMSGGESPSGAVMSFDLAACPEGWTQLTAANGRTIIGTGNSGATGAIPHTLRQTGGEETHLLTISEMPSHTHLWGTDDYSGATGGKNQRDANGGTVWSAETSATGGSQSHNNMQPYLTLLYCKKN